MSTFGERLHEMRMLRAMTMDELAARIRVSKPTIYKLEHDMTVTTPTTYEAIAAALGVSPAWLLGWSDQPARITEDEQQLLDLYRSLNAQGRQTLLVSAQGIAQSPAFRKDTPNTAT